jgi:hypothetical protein
MRQEITASLNVPKPELIMLLFKGHQSNHTTAFHA